MGAGRRGVHVSGVLRPVFVTIIKSFKDVLCRFGLQSNEITHKPSDKANQQQFFVDYGEMNQGHRKCTDDTGSQTSPGAG